MSNTSAELTITWITPLFAVTSELTSDDFAKLAEMGIKSVVSNRPDGEESGQLLAKREAALAWRAGLTFRHVPAAKHELFTDDVVEAMADALGELAGPVVAHCKSGMRSAIVWAAASARSQSVDCVLLALEKAGFDLEVIRDDLDAQADRKRWLGRSAALDCGSAAAVERLPAKPSRDAA
ncbi:MAG: TIGR01244 family sulfur transferase [Hyphomicrobiaceae bacterium]